MLRLILSPDRPILTHDSNLALQGLDNPRPLGKHFFLDLGMFLIACFDKVAIDEIEAAIVIESLT